MSLRTEIDIASPMHTLPPPYRPFVKRQKLYSLLPVCVPRVYPSVRILGNYLDRCGRTSQLHSAFLVKHCVGLHFISLSGLFAEHYQVYAVAIRGTFHGTVHSGGQAGRCSRSYALYIAGAGSLRSGSNAAVVPCVAAPGIQKS